MVAFLHRRHILSGFPSILFSLEQNHNSLLTTERPPPIPSCWISSPPSPFQSLLVLRIPLHPLHHTSSPLPFLLRSKVYLPLSYPMPFQVTSQRDFSSIPNPPLLQSTIPTLQKPPRPHQASLAPLLTNLSALNVFSFLGLTQLGEFRKPGTRSLAHTYI